MKKKSLLKIAIGTIVLASGLFITNPTQNDVQAVAPTKVMWGKTELKLGQIGKTTILKETPLVKINADGSLSTVRMLKKGDEFRTYQYKGQNGGLYGVGSASFIQKSNMLSNMKHHLNQNLHWLQEVRYLNPINLKHQLLQKQQQKNLKLSNN